MAYPGEMCPLVRVKAQSPELQTATFALGELVSGGWAGDDVLCENNFSIFLFF